MKTKIFFLVLLCSTFSLSAFAQIDMKVEEEKLLQVLKKLRSPDASLDLNKLSVQFENDMKAILKKEESWSYRFPELRKYIDIKQSKDKKIKTFSWDSRMGGSWHDLRTLIQHQTTAGLLVSSLQNKIALDDEEQSIDEAYRDAAIINIYTFHNGYLFEGIGTHGSGNHHKVLMYYELEGDALERKTIFENKQSIYVLLIPRRYKFDLEVDIEAKTITHSEYVLDNEIGFYMPTDKKVLLSFDGRTFKKTIKN
ncbi:MAG: hypothetical protein AAF611_16620 [Bacteroidota bacterium]